MGWGGEDVAGGFGYGCHCGVGWGGVVGLVVRLVGVVFGRGGGGGSRYEVLGSLVSSIAC